MKPYIIAAGAILLIVGATLATAQERPGWHGRRGQTYEAPPGHGGEHGRGEWRGNDHGHSRGHERGGWWEGRRGPRWEAPRWGHRRVHYHGGFWRWVFGHGCWCGHQGQSRRGGGHGRR